MDIDLLSKMVKELILDNERVVLPGLGSFVAEIVPATFSDKGYTINPPYRKLYFRSKPDEGSDLIAFYAKSNSVSEEIAEKVIVDFVTELKNILFHKKTIIFPGLGRLRATKENNVFFVADEDLDIYPEGFGLEPISLKTHQASASEVKAAVSDLKAILTEPEVVVEPKEEQIEVSVVEPEVEVTAEPAQEPEQVTMAVADSETMVESVADPEIIVEPSTDPEALVEQPAIVREEPQIAVENEIQIVDENVTGTKTEKGPVAKQAKKRSAGKMVLLTLMWIVIAVVVLTAAYVAVCRFCPEWIDQFLYTQEELELLRPIYE